MMGWFEVLRLFTYVVFFGSILYERSIINKIIKSSTQTRKLAWKTVKFGSNVATPKWQGSEIIKGVYIGNVADIFNPIELSEHKIMEIFVCDSLSMNPDDHDDFFSLTVIPCSLDLSVVNVVSQLDKNVILLKDSYKEARRLEKSILLVSFLEKDFVLLSTMCLLLDDDIDYSPLVPIELFKESLGITNPSNIDEVLRYLSCINKNLVVPRETIELYLLPWWKRKIIHKISIENNIS